MNKLPAELLSDIVDVACSNFEEKDSAQLLCNLCLTSQILRLICQPKLFSSISATTNSSLRRLLQQDARLASYVRRIEMIWLYPRNADAADRARVEDWKGGQLADLASLCSDCQNLDSIELDCRPATSWIDEEASIHGWKAQEPSAALFQQVTSLTVRSQSAVDDPTANGLFLLALLPQVTNLRISFPGIQFKLSRSPTNTLKVVESHSNSDLPLLQSLAHTFNFVVDEVFLLRDLQVPGSKTDSIYRIQPDWSTAKRLTLYTGKHDIRQLLYACSNLFSLTLSRLPVTPTEHNERIFSLLSASSSATTLTHLKLGEYSWKREDDWPILFSSAFPQLRRLDVSDSLSIETLPLSGTFARPSDPSILQLSKDRPGLTSYFTLGMHQGRHQRAYAGEAEFVIKGGVLHGANGVRRFDGSLTALEKRRLIDHAKRRLGWIESEQDAEI